MLLARYSLSELIYVYSFILVDKPSDQKSRWLSDGNKPPQEVSYSAKGSNYFVLCTVPDAQVIQTCNSVQDIFWQV